MHNRKLNTLWQYSPIDPTRPLRFSCRYLRTMILPAVNEQHPMSAFPGAMVLAEQRILDRGSPKRQIFFVLTNGFHTDGLWLPNIKRRFRESTIVDAGTLGPRGKRYGKVSHADRRIFRHHRKLIAAQWAAELADNAPCEVYRSRWQSAVDWFTRSHPDATSVALRSEIEIVSTNSGLPRGSYIFYQSPAVQEGFINPTIPNEIHSRMLGGSKEIVAFARIAAPMQADAGLTKWTQRIFYINYADWFDGKTVKVPANSSDYVNARSVTPGILGEDFDPRILDGYNLDNLFSQRKEFESQT